MLEKARDDAVAAVMNPGRIPLSGETVTLGGMRLILAGLDDVEMAMAGQTARLICAATGVTADIETEVRQRVAAEQEQEDRPADDPSGLSDGRVVAHANPFEPATPQAFHPSGPDVQPTPTRPLSAGLGLKACAVGTLKPAASGTRSCRAAKADACGPFHPGLRPGRAHRPFADRTRVLAFEPWTRRGPGLPGGSIRLHAGRGTNGARGQ